MSSWADVPMRRNLPQPLDAGVLHGDVRVEALGDGTGDEGGALLLEQLDQPLLLRHQRIDPCRLPVQERCDGTLLGCRWALNGNRVHVALSELVARGAIDESPVIYAV